jgi:hypothetical protein
MTPWNGPSCFAPWRLLGADDPWCGGSAATHDTRAYTVVHGHVSNAQTWQAGVRQGCPLSPLLYLFVAEALACWHTRSWGRQYPELGVLVANQRHVSLHHADDTKVFLSSLQPESVQSLVVRLDTFASEQRINIA